MRRWWSSKTRLHRDLAVAAPDREAPERHRRADWPRCPQCGADELMSTAPLTQQPQPTNRMRCLACGWTGVAVRETAE